MCIRGVQIRAGNRYQGYLHNRTSDGHPLLATDTTALPESQSSSMSSSCRQRYSSRLQVEARAHQADRIADEKQQVNKTQKNSALRHVQENRSISNKLAEQYPHGLPRAMIRKLRLEQNISETPGGLGFGQ